MPLASLALTPAFFAAAPPDVPRVRLWLCEVAPARPVAALTLLVFNPPDGWAGPRAFASASMLMLLPHEGC